MNALDFTVLLTSEPTCIQIQFLLAEKMLCCFLQVIKHLSLNFPSDREGNYYFSQWILKIDFLAHLEDIQMLRY